MEKIDLRKELKYLYSPPSKQVQVVEVPRFNFIMIDGKMGLGEEPATSSSFQEALNALYGASFTLKFMSKLRKSDPIDFTVMAAEGLWWVESGEFDFNRKEAWRWTLLMLQPEHITQEMYEEAVNQLKAKRDQAAISNLRFEGFHEGLCMQIMHIGPYRDEPRTIERMISFARENGYAVCGKHHEIYMGDPRRAKPEKLKTILRYPIEKITS